MLALCWRAAQLGTTLPLLSAWPQGRAALDLGQTDWCLGKGNVWPNSPSASAVSRKRHFRATVMHLQLHSRTQLRAAGDTGTLQLLLPSFTWVSPSWEKHSEYSRLIFGCLAVAAREGGQPAELLTAEPSLGLPSFLKETHSETSQGPYSKTQH